MTQQSSRQFIQFVMFIFFFQAEDGIRDAHVTGVQTCALPISSTTSVKLNVEKCQCSAPWRDRARSIRRKLAECGRCLVCIAVGYWETSRIGERQNDAFPVSGSSTVTWQSYSPG